MGEIHDTALDLSSAFLHFKDYLGESAPDVTSVAAELLAINSAIVELKSATDPRLARRITQVDSERQVVLESIDATFKEIRRYFGNLDSPYRGKKETYRSVWRQIDTYFKRESNYSLLKRLELYKNFLRELISTVNKYVLSDPVAEQ